MDIEVKGLNEFRRRMERYKDIADAETKKAMGQAVVTVQSEARKLVPVNIGRLRSSIATEVRAMPGADIEGAVGTNLIYGPAVELGAKPHWAPLEPILFWVRRKRKLSGPDAIRQAILIQRIIARGGTRAQPFLVPALEKNQDKITELFNEAIKRTLKRMLG